VAAAGVFDAVDAVSEPPQAMRRRKGRSETNGARIGAL
jgi:hypothetical protein